MPSAQLVLVTGNDGSEDLFIAALAIAEAVARGMDACCFLTLPAAARMAAEVKRRQLPLSVVAYPLTCVPLDVVDRFPSMMTEIGAMPEDESLQQEIV